MKFSKKSRYGLRALIDLSVNSKTDHVALSSIAERNSISLQYLEQVFASLRRAEIVKSIKGPQGGYLLNDNAENITVASILEALDGSYQIEAEESSEDDKQQAIIKTIQTVVIDNVNEQLDEILKNITLADLEKEYLTFSGYEQNMYYI
ncbi:RrF2 family transcriptional regulator [Clostridium sp. C105KSO13]|uniref:RrF2 family transcriptional regulator n=1 Tax=Clostridium sp. C105KSO13 TaxID=1776045 RepID=UPI0007407CF0|nr:Rrf2 family transcriptional regulator [Clostridium sp. C105KSO13]CUX44846.1 HTH-type transcriptional regulator IscR [Clostridium sp. C105KSO13]